MINPLRSEQDAFRFTLIVGGVARSRRAGGDHLQHRRPALAVAGGLAIGLVVGLFVLKRDEPPEKMLLGPPPRGRRRRPHRILVVANETLSGAALRDEISQRGHRRRGAAEGRVPGAQQQDQALDQRGGRSARARRAAPAGAARRRCDGEGFDADGDIGDDDPVQAMEDALRRFPADEVIISTHPPGRSNWLERDVVERARERFDIPVTHVVVDLDREGAARSPRRPAT